MAKLHARSAVKFSQRLGGWLVGPHMLAFVPAIALSAFWIAGELALVIVALGLPLVFLASGALKDAGINLTRGFDPVTGLPMQTLLETEMQRVLDRCSEKQRKSALFLVQLEEFEALSHRYGQGATNALLERVGQRFKATLREHDQVFWLGGTGLSKIP